MKRYPVYKDSGVEWLREIPEQWSIKKAKWIFREVSNKNYPNEPLLSATQEHGVVPRDLLENRVMMPMGELVNYKLVEEGNFVISLRSFEGGIEYSKFRGLVSPAYTVLQNKILIEKRFFTYLMKSLHFIQELNKAITGVRDGKNINYKDFTEIYFPIVPNLEQKAIAHFLDHKLEQIEQYIRNKTRLIELLNEQKTAIINRAVTKGINPNVPMKHSGIEWLGEIPAHWEVKKLKYVKNSEPNSFVDGPFGSNLKSIHYIKDGAVYVVESGFITSGKFILKDFKTISREHFETIKRSSCKGGDIIISKIGANFGMSGILPELNREAVISGNSLKLTINLRLYDTKYIHYHLLSLKNRGTFDLIVNATAQPALSLGTMNNIAVVIPPLYEQQSIVSFIEQELAKIDLVIAQIEKEIELIQEYRTTLISDAVTGKIDVRGFDNSSNSRNSPKPPELATM